MKRLVRLERRRLRWEVYRTCLPGRKDRYACKIFTATSQIWWGPRRRFIDVIAFGRTPSEAITRAIRKLP